jgi:hypothetical protein
MCWYEAEAEKSKYDLRLVRLLSARDVYHLCLPLLVVRILHDQTAHFNNVFLMSKFCVDG